MEFMETTTLETNPFSRCLAREHLPWFDDHHPATMRQVIAYASDLGCGHGKNR